MQWTAIGHVALHILQKMSSPCPMPRTSWQPEKIDEEEKDRITTIQLDESESKHKGSDQEELNTHIEESIGEGEIEDTDSTCLE